MPRYRAKERACEKAIKETLAYRAFFKYPLSFHQLSTYLISSQKFDYRFFKKTLRRLLKNNSVKIKEGKYFLPSVKPLSWDLRAKRTKRIIHKNKKVFEVLKIIPWVKMVCITGSVAAYNAEKNVDLDVFIVTTKNRLWLSRGFVVIVMKILGVYPEGENDKGKLCPNIFIDENGLMWPKDKQNLYTAHEVIMMQPMIEKDDMYFRFMRANDWALKYFSHFRIEIPKRIKSGPEEKSIVVNLLEKLAMYFERRYMKAKQTTEITTKHLIHFNKKDSTRKVLREFRKRKRKMS